MKYKKKVPESDLVTDIGSLTIGGFGLTRGVQSIEKLPQTSATSGVSSGLTTVSRFYPTFAGLSSFGYATKKLKKIEKSVKGGKK